MNKGAVFSLDRIYRYSLWRVWDEAKPIMMVVGLNGSTADENRNDPTITRLMWRAGTDDFGGLFMVNLHAYCSTNPSDLLNIIDPTGPDNDLHIRKLLEKLNGGKVICGWGTYGGYFQERVKAVVALLPSELYCWGMTKNGQPRHPLYVPYSQPLLNYSLQSDRK